MNYRKTLVVLYVLVALYDAGVSIYDFAIERYIFSMLFFLLAVLWFGLATRQHQQNKNKEIEL